MGSLMIFHVNILLKSWVTPMLHYHLIMVQVVDGREKYWVFDPVF